MDPQVFQQSFLLQSAANVSCGNFGAILALASVHNRPVVVNDCPDVYKFQADHPSAIVCLVNKVPPAIIAWGLFLLAQQAGGPAVAQPPSAVTGGPTIAQPPPAVVSVASLASDPQFVIHMAHLTSVGDDTPSIRSSPLLSYDRGSSG